MKCPDCHFENPENTRFCSNCGIKLAAEEEISVTETKTYPQFREELPIGSLFAGRFQIIEELGRGGMGRVYKVLDREIEETVALKLLRPEIAADEKTIRRFRNELKFARKISHENVCRMYDLNKEGETHFITMEYVAGENLKRMIKMMGNLGVGKTIFIAKQVCQGLAQAHKLGVVHRDLKPGNIMIDREGNARIMDFGIARSLEARDITDRGAMIGTPKYMAPEQVEGREVDQRSDIYALGVILYEMLTGKVPFVGDTTLEIALKHKVEMPQEPRRLNSQIPGSLNRAVLKCLEKDKESRYQSAEEVLSELARIEEEVPTVDRVFPKKRPKKEAVKWRVQAMRALVIFLIIALLISAGYFFFTKILGRGSAWKNSIAVLPFEDFSPQKDQEYLCVRMTEAIITKMSSIDELKVTPYHTVSRYKDTDKSLQKIGEELGVDTILVPNLRREENKIRVSAQLNNVKENFVIESFTYEKDLKSVFEVEDSISKSIAKSLKVQLIEEKLAVAKKREPSNIRAYEFYAKGNFFERKFREFNNQEDLENAVGNLKNAIAIDPNYALAYWGLGNVYEALFASEGKREDLDLMLDYFRKAYEIDPNLAEANVGLGWAYFYKEDWDKAYQFCKRALQIDPDSIEINFNVGAILRSIGLYRNSVKFYSRALELDPLNANYRNSCVISYMLYGEYHKAIELLRVGLELDPENVGLRLFYARQFIMMKKYNEAEEEIAKAENLDPENPSIQYTRAFISAAKGERDRALAIIRDKDPYYLTYLISSIYAALGMKDEAIENIEKAIERGFYEIKTYLYSYPFLMSNHFYDSLRDDHRFQEIVKREKEKHEEKLKKYGDL